MTGKTSDGNPASSSSVGSDGSGQSSTGSGSTAGGGGSDGDGGSGAAGGGRDNGDGSGGVGARPGEQQGGGVGGVGDSVALTPAAGDDGGSPLVPILIALAVLAAISIGVVAMRKRGQDVDPGAPASPEAG